MDFSHRKSPWIRRTAHYTGHPFIDPEKACTPGQKLLTYNIDIQFLTGGICIIFQPLYILRDIGHPELGTHCGLKVDSWKNIHGKQ